MLRFIIFMQVAVFAVVTVSAAVTIHGNNATSSFGAPPVVPASFRQLQKIIGGEIVKSSEYPWFGASFIKVERLNEDPRSFICGSSFIHSDIVISAASCAVEFIRDNPRDTTKISIEIYVGLNRTNGTFDSVYEVTDIYWPRNYVTAFDTVDNNIVFYKLSNSTSVPPLSWNTDPSIPSVGDIVTTFGFGRVANDGLNSASLRKIDVSILSNAECRDIYPFGFRFFDQSTLCTFTPGKFACAGDFGGPLVTQDGVLVGLTAFSRRTGCDQGPQGFTKVSYYRDMIASVSREHLAWSMLL